MEPVQTVAIMGMGYVGLTLSVVLAKRGFKVYAVEVDKDVVATLRRGVPHFQEKGLTSLLQHQQRLGNLEVVEALPNAPIDAYVISVGTPLKPDRKEPNVAYIRSVVKDVGGHMRPGSLVVLRSTVPVGLSRSVVIPLLEDASGLKAGEGFSYVFAPERTMEGKAIIELESNPQVIGGVDEESVRLATDLFRRITRTIVVVSSIEGAEMIKLIDNTYRDVRFAFCNEIAMICEALSLDATELIQAANTHYPRNDIPIPSPGVGGPCLAKDPHILYDLSVQHGYEPAIVRQSRAINEWIPVHIVDRLEETLAAMGKDLRTAKIFVSGFAFKGDPETSDLRDSTTIWLTDELRRRQATVHGFDPVVRAEDLAKLGVKPAPLEEGCRDADAVLFMNNHPSYRDFDPFLICGLLNKPAVFFDAWRMFEKDVFAEIEGVQYMGVGA